MDYRKAKKLLNEDEVTIKHTKEIVNCLGDAYIDENNEKIIRIDVITKNGAYIPGLHHKEVE